MAHPLLDALGPVADALGATLLAPDDLTEADIPLLWEGEVVGGIALSGNTTIRDEGLARIGLEAMGIA